MFFYRGITRAEHIPETRPEGWGVVFGELCFGARTFYVYFEFFISKFRVPLALSVYTSSFSYPVSNLRVLLALLAAVFFVFFFYKIHRLFRNAAIRPRGQKRGSSIRPL